MDKFRIDGHKMAYHTARVSDWLGGSMVYPIYVEISPSGLCNHRCVFCAYDFIGYPNRRLDTERLLPFIGEMARCGVKSVLYAGEGEPLLHKDISKIVTHTRTSGIDVGMFTNGQLLKREISEAMLSDLTFLRFSFNGGTDESYAQVHGVASGVFNKVIANIAAAVDLKRKNALAVDIGAQYVLLPENKDSAVEAVKILRDIGVDYVAIKPFVHQSPMQSYQMKGQLIMEEITDILAVAEALSNERFNAIARRSAFDKPNTGRGYNHCYGTSFISVVNSAGQVSSCPSYWDKEEFLFGNIYENTFEEIWFGPKRKSVLNYLENTIDTHACPSNCRPHNVNEFLWEIRHPTIKHINFI